MTTTAQDGMNLEAFFVCTAQNIFFIFFLDAYVHTSTFFPYQQSSCSSRSKAAAPVLNAVGITVK